MAMTRWILALLTTGVAAATAGYWWARTPQENYLVEPGPAASKAPHATFASRDEGTSQLSAAEAEKQRSLQYRDLHTIDELRALPAEFSRREALYAIAGRADWPQLRELIGEATALPNEAERLATLETLWLRYAELDPDAALRSALETDRATATRLIAVIAQTQPEQAWNAVARITDPMVRMAYQGAVITSWASQQPDRAFASAQAMPQAWQRRQLLQKVTSEVAQRDPAYALELLKSVDPAEQQSLRRIVADEWVRFDPAGAAGWIATVEPGLQGQLAYQIADAYLAQQPDEALAWALRIARSPGRNLWSHMVGEIARENHERAWQLAQGAENPAQRMKASGAVIDAIAARDPALAMSYLQKLPPGMYRNRIAVEVGSTVAFNSPAAAISWLESIDDNRMRIEVANNMGYNLAPRDVEMAVQLVDRVPKEARDQWVQAIAMSYANFDPAAGADWLARYRDVPEHVLQTFAANVADSEEDVTLDLVERFTDDRQREVVLRGLLPKIAQQAPETAARLVDDISDLHARAEAASRVAGVWSQYDEPAARKWVLSMPWGDARDNGIAAIIAQSSSVDDKLSLLGQIQSPEKRASAIFTATMSLAVSDPEGARTVMRRYPLDPQQQARLEDALRRQKNGSRWMSTGSDWIGR
jgi:hypothetical protein